MSLEILQIAFSHLTGFQILLQAQNSFSFLSEEVFNFNLPQLWQTLESTFAHTSTQPQCQTGLTSLIKPICPGQSFSSGKDVRWDYLLNLTSLTGSASEPPVHCTHSQIVYSFLVGQLVICVDPFLQNLTNSQGFLKRLFKLTISSAESREKSTFFTLCSSMLD